MNARTITVSRQYGAGGRRVAQALAEALDYELVERELVDEAAGRLGFDPKLAEDLDERTPSFLEEVGMALAAASPETLAAPNVPDDRLLAREVRRVIESLAAKGGYVILGRGSQVVLHDDPRSVHVQLVGDPGDRAANVAQWQGIAVAEARDLCKHRDAERAAYVRRFCEADINDPRLYHAVLNTSRMSVERAAAIVLSIVQN